MDKRILLIDFDPVAAELTGALLATRGIPFTLARNHAELDRALTAGPPALVVIDPARPDETEGMRLCTKVAERLAAAGPVPMILASRSLRGPRWKAFARDAGAELFLERPQDDRLLLAAAERALNRAATASASHPAGRSAPAAALRPTAPAAPAAVTTTSAHRAPPPAENELENMVDQMFAQWFAEGDAPSGSAAAPPAPPPARPAAAPSAPAPSAPAAVRPSGVGAAVLDAPRSAPAEAARGAVPAAKLAAAPTKTAPTPPAPALAAGPVALRSSGVTAPTGPTGPAVAPSRSVPAPPIPSRSAAAGSARATVDPSAAPPRTATAPALATGPAPPAPAVPEPIASPSSSNLKRPLAITAAVALIAVGAGFVYFQGPRTGDGPGPVVPAPGVSGPVEPREAEPIPGPAANGAESSPATPAGTPRKETAAIAPPPAPAKAEPVRPAPQSPADGPPGGPDAVRPPEAAPPRPAPALPPSVAPPPAAAPAATGVPATAAAPLDAATRPEPAPVPEPEAEFIPDVAPDGTIPGVDSARDATAARYTGPEMIPSTRVTPAFPPAARQMKMTGQVKLQVKVRADGSVGAVTVLSEPKPAVGFGKAAAAAVRQWRYRPATLGDRAVESEITVVVHFAGD